MGERGTRILGIPINATVAEVSSSNGWHFRRCRDPQINDILDKISKLQAPSNQAGNDVKLWSHGNQLYRPFFSAKKTWKQIRKNAPHVPWHRGVWFPQCLPRQAFITWMTVKNRLPTGDRMNIWRINNPAKECILCKETDETRDHLFFACSYSFNVWRAACEIIPLQANQNWQIVLRTTYHNSLTSQKSTRLKIVFQACIYHIWRERNQRHHNNIIRTATTLVETITKEVYDRTPDTNTVNLGNARNN